MISSKSFIIFSALILFVGVQAKAQQNSGNVVFNQDSLIISLQNARIHYANQLSSAATDNVAPHKPGTKTTVLGFRIQIYTGSSRNAAYDAQARFKNLYPDIATYISYTQPNYRVKVGDFRSRRQATALMSELRKRFSPVFLFTEEVNVYY